MRQAPSLRPVHVTDAQDVLEVFASPGMERQGTVTNLDQARDLVEQMASGADRAVFAIELDHTVAGAVGVTSIDTCNRTAWFWYWMHGDHRGQGWTSRAAATVASWALTCAGLQRLELGHRIDNPASGGVTRAAGFVHEGTERRKFLIEGRRVDVLTYGRLHTDPHPSTPPLHLAPPRGHN